MDQEEKKRPETWKYFPFIFSDLINALCFFNFKGIYCSSMIPENIFLEYEPNG